MLPMMKKKLAYGLLFALVCLASCSFTSNKEENDKDKLLLEVIQYILKQGHFDPKTIDDNYSIQVYDHFIQGMDPMKRYFTQADIQEFKKFQYQLDDQFKAADIAFFDLVYQRLVERMAQTKPYVSESLTQPWDFDQAEFFESDYKALPYAQGAKELKERWRLQLKYMSLSSFIALQEAEKTKKEENPAYEVKSDSLLESEARNQTKTTMDEYFDFVEDLARKDYFAQYVNALVESFDPHTSYLAPEEKDRFDIDMSGKFEGIGARLSKRMDQTKITEIISGGPVWRDQALEVGDEILMVGQEGEEPVSIVGMRLDDAIKLIKGPKGTTVYLWVKKVDGTKKTVSVVRDVVELEETYAKSAKVEKEGHTYGIINLPKFYVDFVDQNTRNAATDLAKEVDKLKKEGVEGLVIDLRNNGGGSLKTVVDIAGLFIAEGPIVQVKSSDNQVDVYMDEDPKIQWDGPLVILVNELSASASEILAAAMQDYERAVVIGSTQTFGKGTVQNLIDLNRVIRNSDYGDLGSLKITTQKFYRINGGSTQLAGVRSDIPIVGRYSYLEVGEREMDKPLPWDQIEPAVYKPWTGYINYQETIARSKARMAKNTYLSLLDQNALWIKEQQDQTQIPLRLSDFLAEVESDELKAKEFSKIAEFDNKLTFSYTSFDAPAVRADADLVKARDRWHRELAKDLYIDEALNVLEDLKLKFTDLTKLTSVDH